MTTLYGRIVAQSRTPWFYETAGAPDTAEGRFEVLALHMALVLKKLNDAAQPKHADMLMNVFFQNMDDSLREMGVGDLSVAKKMRKLAEAFYGRINAYAAAMAGEDKHDEALRAALNRNVAENAAEDGGAALAAYAREAAQTLESEPFETLLEGSASFPALSDRAANAESSAQ